MCYSTRVTDFTLSLQPGSSICDQAVYAAKKALISGQLRPGEPFPSVRALSRTLKINPNTAHKVIARLTADRLLEVKPGIGTIVARVGFEDSASRNSLLKNDLERVAVEAKRVGLKLEDLTAALTYHWTQLDQIDQK
jgi:GntR family transcriptional regulator